MDKTNFLLACAGVIPLLALTILIELRIYQAPHGATEKLSLEIRLYSTYGILWAFLVASVGEFLCLHGLDLGTVSRLQIALIWAVLGVLTVTLAFGLLAPIWIKGQKTD